MEESATLTRLGAKVSDRISGFEGIVVGRAQYLFGCRQVLVAPETTEGGKLLDSVWLDEDRVVEVAPDKEVNFVRPDSAGERAGGPTTPPPTGISGRR